MYEYSSCESLRSWNSKKEHSRLTVYIYRKNPLSLRIFSASCDFDPVVYLAKDYFCKDSNVQHRELTTVG